MGFDGFRGPRGGAASSSGDRIRRRQGHLRPGRGVPGQALGRADRIVEGGFGINCRIALEGWGAIGRQRSAAYSCNVTRSN